MHKTILALLTVILLTACQTQPTTLPPQATPTPTPPTETTTIAPTPQETWEEHLTAKLKGDAIYCGDEKVGKLDGQRIYLKLLGETVSFDVANLHGTDLPANVDGLGCVYDYTNENTPYIGFNYYELEVSPRLYPPYAVYETIETPEENARVTYKCDGSLVQLPTSDSGAGFGIYDQDAPNYFCETEGSDYLTQYEFQGASVHPILVTGGEYGEFWRKVFIKKGENGLNYFFLGGLTTSTNLDDYWIAGDSEAKRTELVAKAYLENLLKSPSITQKIAIWEQMVGSFRVEDKNSSIALELKS